MSASSHDPTFFPDPPPTAPAAATVRCWYCQTDMPVHATQPFMALYPGDPTAPRRCSNRVACARREGLWMARIDELVFPSRGDHAEAA